MHKSKGSPMGQNNVVARASFGHKDMHLSAHSVPQYDALHDWRLLHARPAAVATGPGRLTSSKYRQRKRILHEHQGGKCFWCPTVLRLEDATMDELIPRSRGGTQRWDNIVVACEPCNSSRADNSPPAWAIEKVKARGRVVLDAEPPAAA
jgi:hypothetical protein